MSLKARSIQLVGNSVVAALKTVDRYVNGSNSGFGEELLRQDPYAGYRYLLDTGPVVRFYAARGWFVVGFEQVQAAFKDPRFGNDMRKNKFLVRLMRGAAGGKPVPTLDNPSLLSLDAPDHTRLRKLVSRGFLHKYIQSLQPQIETIVTECLDAVAGQQRFATQDMEFYGKKIRKDQMLVVMIGGANRDPAANNNPDTFDITRETIKHVSFGYGIHLCLGLALARLEARVAFNAMLDRYPTLDLADQPVPWTNNGFVRGMEQLLPSMSSGS